MRILNTSVRWPRYKFIGQVTLHSFQSILFFQVLLAFLLKNRGNCSFSIWYNIAFFSVIHWISLINLPPNEDLDDFFEPISQIFHLGILPEICPGQKIELKNFKKTGIEFSGFLYNSKDLIFPYFFACSVSGFLIFSAKFMKESSIGVGVKGYTWNFIVRINLLVYLEFITYGFINIYYFSEVNTCSIINLSLSVIFIILGASWLIVHPILLNHHISLSSSPEDFHSKKSISTLTHEFKPSLQNSNYQYYTIFLLYRFLFSISIVFIQNSPTIQISLIFIFQIITSISYLVVYLVSIKPYQVKTDYFSVLISECLLLLLIIFTALQSLPALQGQAQEYIIIVSISFLWLNELAILGRFILSIWSTRSISSPPNPQDSTIQIIQSPQHAIDDLENSNSINNITELNEKIIITYAGQYYKNIETSAEINLNEKIVSPMSPNQKSKRKISTGLNKNINPSPSSNKLLRKIDSQPLKTLKLSKDAKKKLETIKIPEYFSSNDSSKAI